MKNLRILLAGIIFGIIMVKSEAVSWFRIQEMFRFQSFYMYGIICTAIVVGAILLQLVKRAKLKNLDGNLIVIPLRDKLYKAALFGGVIFGIGWAFTGACPGPLFVNLGAGYSVMIVPITAAVLGAFVHGLVKKHLPH
ncbi:MAG: YeeE/YedE family protein [Flavobacteriales bacterium]|nr:YeeE/YedE family protein [Flavobacteriales bacterium]